jgi:hypothetical protein
MARGAYDLSFDRAGGSQLYHAYKEAEEVSPNAPTNPCTPNDAQARKLEQERQEAQTAEEVKTAKRKEAVRARVALKQAKNRAEKGAKMKKVSIHCRTYPVYYILMLRLGQGRGLGVRKSRYQERKCRVEPPRPSRSRGKGIYARNAVRMGPRVNVVTASSSAVASLSLLFSRVAPRPEKGTVHPRLTCFIPTVLYTATSIGLSLIMHNIKLVHTKQ